MIVDTRPTTPSSTPSIECLADQFSGVVDGLIASGVHPHRVTESALLAFLPLAIEATRAPTVEDALLALASRFDGNALRREH